MKRGTGVHSELTRLDVGTSFETTLIEDAELPDDLMGAQYG